MNHMVDLGLLRLFDGGLNWVSLGRLDVETKLSAMLDLDVLADEREALERLLGLVRVPERLVRVAVDESDVVRTNADVFSGAVKHVPQPADHPDPSLYQTEPRRSSSP